MNDIFRSNREEWLSYNLSVPFSNSLYEGNLPKTKFRSDRSEIPTTSRGGPEYSVRFNRNGRTLISLCIVTQVVVQTHQVNLKSSIIKNSVNN